MGPVKASSHWTQKVLAKANPKVPVTFRFAQNDIPIGLCSRFEIRFWTNSHGPLRQKWGWRKCWCSRRVWTSLKGIWKVYLDVSSLNVNSCIQNNITMCAESFVFAPAWCEWILRRMNKPSVMRRDWDLLVGISLKPRHNRRQHLKRVHPVGSLGCSVCVSEYNSPCSPCGKAGQFWLWIRVQFSLFTLWEVWAVLTVDQGTILFVHPVGNSAISDCVSEYNSPCWPCGKFGQFWLWIRVQFPMFTVWEVRYVLTQDQSIIPCVHPVGSVVCSDCGSGYNVL